jgi:soluble lytic murein transglycosylase-like protein
MDRRSSVLLIGIILFLSRTRPSIAEEKIQSYIGPKGSVVFTNLLDNSAVPFSTPTEASMKSAQEIPSPWHSLIDSISNTHGVDPALVRAVMKTESNFNRWAVSSKGALGLMQLIPNTGTRFGVRDFFDPQQNIEGGVRYLKFLLGKFNGDLDLSLAAYNAGENLVERAGRIPSIPETRDYVRKVRANYGKAAPAFPIAAAAETAAVPQQEVQKIYRRVDERGVVHFSNIEPPN